MITPNELRILNWIIHPNGKEKPCNDRVISDLVCHPEVREKYQPISLTPEWLERCGFECETDSFGDGQIAKWYQKDEFKWTNLDGLMYAGKYLEHIKFVHQLQNLIHALTGTELGIKPL